MILHRRNAEGVENNILFIARSPLHLCDERLYFKIYLQD
jgi:hypothetical protein